jgi:hypothetical protein
MELALLQGEVLFHCELFEAKLETASIFMLFDDANTNIAKKIGISVVNS